ncbi:hypothetical protein BHE74_00015506 [Ensete ventricosum]|nr:hypothetical protein BHE74_00015506 [Ensete ventricosum]
MGSRELLLDIDPPELKFHCKPVPPLPFLAYFAGSFCVVATRLGLSDDHVAFKVVVDLGFGFRFLFHSFLATSCETFVSARILCFYYCHDRKDCIFYPEKAIVCSVTMQEQREAPPDMQCKDKFLVQGVVLGEVITANDITQEMVLAVSNNLITNFCNCVCVCTCHV